MPPPSSSSLPALPLQLVRSPACLPAARCHAAGSLSQSVSRSVGQPGRQQAAWLPCLCVRPLPACLPPSGLVAPPPRPPVTVCSLTIASKPASQSVVVSLPAGWPPPVSSLWSVCLRPPPPAARPSVTWSSAPAPRHSQPASQPHASSSSSHVTTPVKQHQPFVSQSVDLLFFMTASEGRGWSLPTMMALTRS